MLLSIVIPAYNASKFLDSLLANLYNQIKGLENLVEVIVVNDGSKDNTAEIVEKYASECTFIRLISQENKGESGARNTGIQNACGEYIYYLDSDDFIQEGSVKHFVETINSTNHHDLYCFGYTSTVNGVFDRSYVCQEYDKKILSQEEFIKAYLGKFIQCHVCSVVTKREIIINNNLQFVLGLKIGADIDYLLKLFKIINDAYYSSKECYIYRIRNDSIMQGYKTYSDTQYHSFEVRRDIVLDKFYQADKYKKYSNFWIENQLLSNINYYLKAKMKDKKITNSLCTDCALLKMPIANGNKKNKIVIMISKVIPVKLILRMLK